MTDIKNQKIENFGLSLSEFVVQESKEKAFEIDIKSQKAFEKEKQKLIKLAKEQINQDFDKKLKTKDVERKMQTFQQVKDQLQSMNVGFKL